MAHISGLAVCVAQWEEQGSVTASEWEFRSIWENNAKHVDTFTRECWRKQQGSSLVWRNKVTTVQFCQILCVTGH